MVGHLAEALAGHPSIVKTVHLDYEGRSGVSILDVGAHRFSIDPRFEILCAAVMDDDDPAERVYLWVNPLFQCPGMDCSQNAEAERLLMEADLIYAHNAPNELANTWGALTQGKACPFKAMPDHRKFRCTAAMARKAGLPNALDELCVALKVADPKDKRGKALIELFCGPDDETGEFVDPHTRPVEWREFGNYCIQDVRAETACGSKLAPFALSGAALETFQFDLRMNQRGIPINVAAAKNAQRIINYEQAGVAAEFRKLVGLNPTQGKKFRPWLKANCGLDLPNLQAATVTQAIEDLERAYEDACLVEHIPDFGNGGVSLRMVQEADAEKDRLDRTLHILELYQKVSFAAAKKVQTMLDCVCPDGRVRGVLMYYGAGTGRWSGKLLQPQNFKKTPKWMREFVDEVYGQIQAGMPAPVLDQLYGNPLELVAGCIRNFIHHPTHEMLDGDYAAVEARIINWLAGQEDIVDLYRRADALPPKRAGDGLDALRKELSAYCVMAGHVYGIPPAAVDADQREVGKRVELGAGFQMGPPKFQQSCKIQYQLDLPLELCVTGIKVYRKTHDKVVTYWYWLNDRAKEAVKNPGAQCGPFRVRQIGGIPFLLFRLRSGRQLAYPYPEITLVPFIPKKLYDEFGEEEPQEIQFRENVTYWGEIRPRYWGRIKIYGGKFAENETQATAADFMAHGSIVAERRGMEPFMLVHDQGLALRTAGQTAEDFERALGDLPAWAKGFPMKVEAKIAPYYRK